MREQSSGRSLWPRRGTALTVMAAMLLIALLAPPAAAHGGPLVHAGVSGPYRVRAFALLADGWLDYSIDLRDAGTGLPVIGATVGVQALAADGSFAEWRALWTGTVYEAIEEVGDARRWTLQININGPLGQATASHELDLQPSSWIWAMSAVAGAIVAALAAHAVVGRRRSRQAGRSSAAT